MAKALPQGFMPPEPSNSGGAEDQGPAFLSAEKDFATDERVSVKILGFEAVEPSQFDPDTERFGLEVQFKGDSRLWAIKVDSPNHRLLSSQLGPVKTWIGKSVTLARMKGKFPNPFIGVIAANKKK